MTMGNIGDSLAGAMMATLVIVMMGTIPAGLFKHFECALDVPQNPLFPFLQLMHFGTGSPAKNIQ